MDIKQYTMMAVGLIVGILLISGVVAPVIANVSDTDDGGSDIEIDPIFTRYSKVDSSTNVTMWPWYDEVNGRGYSFQDPSTHPESVIYTDTSSVLICLDNGGVSLWYDTSTKLAFWSGMVWSEDSESYRMANAYGPILIQNGTVTGDWALPYSDAETVTLEGHALYYANPDGDYVNSFEIVFDEPGDGSLVSLDIPFASDDDVYISGDWYGDGTDTFAIYGTVADNTLNVLFQFPEDAVAVSESAEISLSEEDIVEISFTYGSQNVTLSKDNMWMAEYDDGNYSVDLLTIIGAIPDDGGSGGSGSGISPTLVTVLSVIPLVLTVGLVIGAIGFIRMKN